MTLAEFNAAFLIANNPRIPLYPEPDTSTFCGFGLPDFEPTLCTIHQVAALLRWQGQYLGGGWDWEAVCEVWHFGRYRFIIIGEGSHEADKLPAAILAQCLGVPL